jgi:phosphoribosylformimino-5-aminoimidazole carboxamide ribotide isomerase
VIVVPAIDLRGGRVVRLVEGDPARETSYGDDPVAVARRFAEAGATWLHVVDLDAALGGGASNRETVAAICREADLDVQTGGGLRSLDAIDDALDAGAARAVLGTAGTDPAFVREAAQRFGSERIVVALDVLPALGEPGWRVMVRGWTEEGPDLDELLPRLIDVGASRFLVTSIGADGTLEGPDLDLYRHVTGLSEVPVLASGGVGSRDDMDALATTGVEGVVVGKAFYEGRLPIEAAAGERWR